MLTKPLMCVFPRFSLGCTPRRGGVCRAAVDKRTVGRMYLTLYRVPTKGSCNTQTRGSARPSALQHQVTLPASILRSHLQDDREPRPTKFLRPTLKLTPMGLKPWAVLCRHFMASYPTGPSTPNTPTLNSLFSVACTYSRPHR
jgi:hypothetical protein